MERFELLERLLPLILSPRAHQVRYHGVRAPCASARDRIVPGPRPLRAPAGPEANGPNAEPIPELAGMRPLLPEARRRTEGSEPTDPGPTPRSTAQARAGRIGLARDRVLGRGPFPAVRSDAARRRRHGIAPDPRRNAREDASHQLRPGPSGHPCARSRSAPEHRGRATGRSQRQLGALAVVISFLRRLADPAEHRGRALFHGAGRAR